MRIKMPNYKERVNAVILHKIAEYMGQATKPKARFRRCFNCGEPFPIKIGKYYCSPKCGRKAHYLSFSIRLGR